MQGVINYMTTKINCMQIKKALSTATAVQGSDNYKLGTATAVLPPPRKTNRITTTVWGDGNSLITEAE